jgi:hypothetical protein
MYFDVKQAVVIWNLKLFINLDELYKEFCLLKPSLALCLKGESKQNLSHSDNDWRQTIDFHMVNDYSCLPSVFLCAAFTWSEFS